MSSERGSFFNVLHLRGFLVLVVKILMLVYFSNPLSKHFLQKVITGTRLYNICKQDAAGYYVGSTVFWQWYYFRFVHYLT